MRIRNWLSQMTSRLGMGRRSTRRRVAGATRLENAQRSRLAAYAGGEWSTALLSVEALEDRCLLSAFNEAGTTLKIEVAASETLTIVSAGTSYTVMSSGTWTGTDSANVTGTGTATLTVTAAGLTAFDTVSVTDSGAAAVVNFNDSGANEYSDTFNVVLGNAAAGTISFNGASRFIGCAEIE